MSNRVLSAVWLDVLFATLGWYIPAVLLALALLVFAFRDTGCEGRHELQSSQRVTRGGRLMQSRWRCVACGQRFGWSK